MLSIDILYCILKDVYPSVKINVNRNNSEIRVIMKTNKKVLYDYKFTGATHTHLEHESVIHAITKLIKDGKKE